MNRLQALELWSPTEPERVCHSLGIDLSAEQLAAVTAPLEPGVIIAGAGTGKTTVMAARVVWLVGIGAVQPAQVLGLTFTRKAAAELGNRIRAALESSGLVRDTVDQGQELVMTYDAFAAYLVAEHGLKIGLETDPALLSGASRFRLADRVVRAAHGPFASLSRLRPITVTTRLLQLDAELSSHLLTTQQLRVHTANLISQLEAAPRNNRGNVYPDVARAISVAKERLELAGLVDAYQALKVELGLAEFADQLASAAHLVKQAPSVAASAADQFKVVLLDEYQDTSSAQAQLLRGLFGGGHPITAVGDPFQAIYGWRGAAASNISSFPTDFPIAPGKPARRYALSVNRRSQSQILTAANRIGAPLREEARKEGAAVEPLKAASGANAGVVASAGFETAEQELDWIANSVADVGNQPDPQWSQLAILVRRNADIPPIYEALMDRDVPVEIVGLGGLLSLPEVAPVLATLRLLSDVTADGELLALLSGPRWRIGTADLALLAERARSLGGRAPRPSGLDLDAAMSLVAQGAVRHETACLMDAVMDPGDAPLTEQARTRLQKFYAEFSSLQSHAGEAAPELVRRIVAVSGLGSELLARRSSTNRDPAAQLQKFIDAVTDYVDVDGDVSLTGLLAYFEAELEHGVGLEQAVPSLANSVKLMTVHKSKGLEWERVYLPGLADKVFPSDRVTSNYLRSAGSVPAELRGDASAIPQVQQFTNPGLATYAESLRTEQLLAEDRLAYVAATRAKEVLVASWHIWSPDRVRPRNQSAYFEAIASVAQSLGANLAEARSGSTTNPIPPAATSAPWPIPLDPALAAERAKAAAWVEQAKGGRAPEIQLNADAAAMASGWDELIDLLLAEAAAADRVGIEVQVPASISATSLLWLQSDPQAWASAAVRPMPRRPESATELGTRFHDWVQHRFGLQPSFEVSEAGVESDIALQRLCDAFESGPYANLQPVAVETAFVIASGGHQIRGRIDAVYEGQGPARFQVVDWKTTNQGLDERQLAIYKLAWAKANDVHPGLVDAVFYLVRSGRIIRPKLPDDPQELEALIWANLRP